MTTIHCDHPSLQTREARELAATLRAGGEDVEATNCEECGCWIVAPPRTMSQLEEMAMKLRERSGNAPGVLHPESPAG